MGRKQKTVGDLFRRLGAVLMHPAHAAPQYRQPEM
jgi:hypothetical protein